MISQRVLKKFKQFQRDACLNNETINVSKHVCQIVRINSVERSANP